MGTLFWDPLPGALPCNREVLPLAEAVPGPKACSPCLENKELIVFLPDILPCRLPGQHGGGVSLAPASSQAWEKHPASSQSGNIKIQGVWEGQKAEEEAFHCGSSQCSVRRVPGFCGSWGKTRGKKQSPHSCKSVLG